MSLPKKLLLRDREYILVPDDVITYARETENYCVYAIFDKELSIELVDKKTCAKIVIDEGKPVLTTVGFGNAFTHTENVKIPPEAFDTIYEALMDVATIFRQ